MKSALGSNIITGIAPKLDINGEVLPVPVVADDTFDPPRIVVELPDRALRDLGRVTIDGATSLDAGSVYLSGFEYTVKNAEINTASGSTTVVAGVTDKKIRVLSIVFTLSSDSTVGWKSSSTWKINPMTFSAKGGMTFHPMAGYFLETGASEDLVLVQGSSSDIRGTLNYIEV
jgi:hypothetical protein